MEMILCFRIFEFLTGEQSLLSGMIRLRYVDFVGGSKMTGSQGFPLTKLMAVNTGLARLRRL